jgi:hypothetical protein
MPLEGARYRYKPGTKVRLAFKDGQVVEAKNMKTGATHTPAEFARDRKRSATSKRSMRGRRR